MQAKARYIKKNFDEIAILGAFARLVTSDSDHFSSDEQTVLTALRRSSPRLENASIEDLGDYLKGYDENQIAGIVSNVKGILHEVEFVEMENLDGDSVTAALFSDTNHPGTDVLMFDESTGESWEIQLKATDNSSYVADWVDSHSDGEILVTNELAEKLDLGASGFSNEALTCRTEEVLEKLIKLDNDDTIWS